MNLSVKPPFASRMVIQREVQAPVCGRARPGESVRLAFPGGESVATAGADGAWRAVLPAFSAGGPFSLRISAGEEQLVLDDILAGDVWLCGGQSNMELPLSRVRYMFPEELEEGGPAAIRRYAVPQLFCPGGPPAAPPTGPWQAADGGELPEFSAVGYFFAQALYQRYRVPIGLLSAAVGGTPVCAWMSKDDLAAFPPLPALAEQWADEGAVLRAQEEDLRRIESYYKTLNRADKGLTEAWHAPDFDDAAWPQRQLDRPWDAELSEPGVIWLRKTVHIPQEAAGQPAALFLGTIVDADTVYVNGTKVGGTEYRYPPREYEVPALSAGPCSIVIRVVNLRGQGGFTPGKWRMLCCGGRSLDLNTEWRYQRGAKAPFLEPEFNAAYLPTACYNGMITPLAGFPVKGAIWYQGESDTRQPQGYSEKLTTMIENWRGLWGKNLPFIMTQLAYFHDDPEADWEAIRRETQHCLRLPGTAMVYALDAGEYNDLHPQNKRLVGRRLARAAMQLAYGETMPPTPFQMGPLL